MSTIAAGTSSGTALVSTGNTSGELQLQVNGTTPSVTLAANGSIGVGSTPGYGTSGQVLTSAGTGSAPTWTTPSAGALTFLSTVTASNSATVDVESTFSSTYDVYELVISGVVPANDAEQFRMQMKIGGVYVSTGNYQYSRTGSLATSNSYVGGADTTNGSIVLGNNVQNGASVPINFKMRIYNPSSTALQKAVTWEGYYQDSTTPAVAMSFGAASNPGTAALTGLRFYMGGGNITSGSFRLYGISNS